jgi:hypothetical protein
MYAARRKRVEDGRAEKLRRKRGSRIPEHAQDQAGRGLVCHFFCTE